MCFFFPTGLDYKKLIAVESPLQVLKPVLTSANVHLLAKLANKIPTQVSELRCRLRSFFFLRLLKIFRIGFHHRKSFALFLMSTIVVFCTSQEWIEFVVI